MGVVIIGRNEGDRLKRCIRGFLSQDLALDIIYVDSNSSDDSVAFAESKGLQIINLDMSIPFSAGRARNEGFQALIKRNPALKYIQFVDGDTDVGTGWLDAAVTWLDNHSEDAVVWGRRKELYPEHSIYNAACDVEWGNTPPGYCPNCGGDFMARVDAYGEVGGFNPSVVAGEEPELCFRLREQGWKIYRLDHLMTWHDAAMFTFGQAWQRQVRSGHAYLQGASMHGGSPERFNVRQSVRPWIWGGFIPLCIVGGALVSHWAFVLTLIYPAQMIRMLMYELRRGSPFPIAIYLAVFNVIGKFAEIQGQFKFIRNRLTGALPTIIEYK
ncbi:MAG: glycosyltransferase [Pseudomonadota bacterium]